MKVKSKIIDFYLERGLPMSRMCKLKPRGTTDQDMEAAAVIVYKEIKLGVNIVEDNDLLRYVRQRALTVTDTKKYRRQILEELIDNYREEFEDTRNLKIYAVSLSVLASIYVILRILAELNVITWVF